MSDISLRVLLSASRGNVDSVIGDVAKALGGKSGGLGGALAAVTVGAAGLAVALGVDGVQKAAAFSNAMIQNVAHAGLAKNQFDAVSQSVLQMSTDVGQMPTSLAQALYPILSGLSGITNQSAKAQASLEDLRLSAEDVAGTETSTTTVSNALTATFNALGLQTNNTAANMAHLKTLNDEMEATIIAGNMHWDQYANVAGKLATSIKGTSVAWTEASSALATMTNEGFTAQRSQTYLSNLFTQMELKTDSLAKNAKKLGIAFDENKFKSMNLATQLNYLKDITGGNESEVLKLMNNNATALKTYNALESGIKSYGAALDSIGGSQGATATAFATASSSLTFKTQQFKAAIDVLLIDLGTQLLPILNKVLDWVTPLIKQFSNWVLTSQDLHKWITNIGTFIQYTFLPRLIDTWNAVSTLVQWMQKGSAPAQAILYTLGAIAALKTAKAIGDMASNMMQMGKNAVDAGGKLLQYFSPNSTLAAGIDAVNSKVGNIGTTAMDNAVKVTGASLTEEADLTTVGGTADATAGNMSMIGSAALADAGEMTAAAGTIGGAFATIGGWIADIGGALAGLLGPLAALGLVASSVPDTWKSFVQQGTFNPGNQVYIHTPRGPIFGSGPMPTTGGKPTSSGYPGGWPYGTNYPAPATVSQGLKHYASGGPVLSTGPIYAHQGEYVLPAGQASGAGGITINMTVNNPMRNRQDLQKLVDEIEQEIALRFRSQTGNYSTGGTF